MDKPFSFSIKVIVRDSKGRCLLIKRSLNSKGNPGKWDFPGGKLEAGEEIDKGLLREVVEETGLSIQLIGVAGSAQSEMPDRRVAYLIMEARMIEGSVQLSEEHTEYIWVDVKKMPEMDLVEQFRTFAHIYSRM